MPKKKRSGIDQRRGEDRRTVYDVEYFLNGGAERRSWTERRSSDEWRDALINLLERKGIITKEELLEEVKRLGAHRPNNEP